MIAGTAFTQVTPERPTRAQKSVRWKWSSRLIVAPACRVAMRPTTWALMWNRGRGLKPWSASVSPLWSATRAPAASSWRVVSRMTLGAPVVPEDAITTPPPPSPVGGPSDLRRSAASPSASSTCAARPRRAARAAKAAGLVAGIAGSTGATHSPAAIAAR